MNHLENILEFDNSTVLQYNNQRNHYDTICKSISSKLKTLC